MQKIIFSVLILILVVFAFKNDNAETIKIIKVNNFEECVLASYPIQESYPRKCIDGEENSFTEYIGNQIEKKDLITVETPTPNQSVANKFEIRGKARGFWFFEASLPARILDQNKKEVFVFSIETTDEWMTEEFVNFEKVVDLGTSTVPQKGYLEIMKSNPSDLSENNDSLIIPISFSNNFVETQTEVVQ